MKFLTTIILLFSLTLSVKSQSTELHTLKVTIKTIKSNTGSVTINVFDSKGNFLKKALKSQTIEAKKGECTFTFSDLPSGEYTVFAMHDKNGNGELDMNMFGIPNEPYGLSKKGKNRFGPPVYEGAVFAINKDSELVVSVD